MIAVIGAISAALVGLIAAYRGMSGDRFQRKVAESAALLSGYTEMVDGLRDEIKETKDQNAKEIGRLQTQHSREMAALERHHEDDRRRWEATLSRCTNRIEQLEAQVASLLVTFKDRGPDTQ